MTEERGLIGNWLTWPRYTWSHNISHPSRVGEFDAFFNKRLHGSRTSCFSPLPPYWGLSLSPCGWKIVWMKPCCLTTSKPSLQRGRVGMIFAWRMQLSYCSCECRRTSGTSTSRVSCAAVLQLPQTDRRKRKETAPHTLVSIKQEQDPLLLLPRWIPGVIFLQEHRAASMPECRLSKFFISHLIGENLFMLLQCTANTSQSKRGVDSLDLKALTFDCFTCFASHKLQMQHEMIFSHVHFNMISPIKTAATLAVQAHAWWERVRLAAICE